MKNLYTLVFILSIQMICHSQTLDWAGQFSSATGVAVTDMSNDIQGNLYLCGTFGDTADFDPGPAVLELTGKTYFTKLDALGNLIWARSFDGFGPSVIRTDAAQNVYLGFNLDATLDVDPGPGTLALTPSGSGDFVILKFDSNGNLLWAQQYGGSSSDRIICLDVSDNGEIYASGTFRNTVDFNLGASTNQLTSFGGSDIYMLHLDANGDFQWVKQFGGTGFDYCESLIRDNNGDIFFMGEFTGTADFDPSMATFNLTSQGNSDIYICKLNSIGDLQWVGNMGTTMFQSPFSLSQDNDGHVFVAGSFSGSGDFDPGTGVSNLSSTGEQSAFVSKISKSTGDLVWTKAFLGTHRTDVPSVVVNDQGTVFTVGGFSGTTDFDPGSGVFNLVGDSIVDIDIFISRLDSDGNFECARIISGVATQLPRRLLLSPNGDLVMTGIFEDTVDFDPGPGVTNLTNNGDSAPLSNNESDVFIIQLSGVAACPSLSIENVDLDLKIDVFPNPTNGPFRLSLNREYSELRIRIFDVTGRTISNQTLINTDNVQLNLNQNSGLYFIALEMDGIQKILKIVKQ